MVLVMVVVMMIIVDVREILCVAAIIARSLDITIMRKMIAVKKLKQVKIFIGTINVNLLNRRNSFENYNKRSSKNNL